MKKENAGVVNLFMSSSEEKGTKGAICNCLDNPLVSLHAMGKDFDSQELLCSFCGMIKIISPSLDFYTLLGIPQSYDVSFVCLQKNYLARQLFAHPDLWLGKSSMAQMRARDYSAKVNEAYKTLKCPMRRAEYLLILKENSSFSDSLGLQSYSLPQNELLALFSLRERLETELSISERHREEKNLLAEKSHLSKSIQEAFDSNSIEEVKQFLSRVRFIDRALELVKE